MLNKVSLYAIACLFEPKSPVRNDMTKEESCLDRFVLICFFLRSFSSFDNLTPK